MLKYSNSIIDLSIAIQLFTLKAGSTVYARADLALTKKKPKKNNNIHLEMGNLKQKSFIHWRTEERKAEDKTRKR